MQQKSLPKRPWTVGSSLIGLRQEANLAMPGGKTRPIERSLRSQHERRDASTPRYTTLGGSLIRAPKASKKIISSICPLGNWPCGRNASF